jgi:hypothetical protein
MELSPHERTTYSVLRAFGSFLLDAPGEPNTCRHQAHSEGYFERVV